MRVSNFGYIQFYRKMDIELIKKNFSAIRRKKGLSWADLTAKAGVTNYQIIYNRLTGKGLTLATLEKLAALLDCDPAELITTGKVEKTPPNEPVLICPHCGQIIHISAHKENTQENTTPENVSKQFDTLF